MARRWFVSAMLLAMLLHASAATGAGDADSPAVPIFGYRVVNEYPHDREAFTQGLVYVDGVLYEGTGSGNGSDRISSLRTVDLESGEVTRSITSGNYL